MTPTPRKRRPRKAVKAPSTTREERFLRNWGRTTLVQTPLATDVEPVSGNSMHAFDWNSLTEVHQRTKNQIADRVKVELVLRGHEAVLCKHLDSLQSNDYIIVCMAWLTETAMLEALLRARKRGVFVQLIVQKEAWLRTNKTLLEKYKQLGKNTFLKSAMPFVGDNSVILGSRRPRGETVTIDAVRVFGDGRDSELRPLLHHKMCVMGRITKNAHGSAMMSPGRVISGSFNWTRRSLRSLENFTILHSPVLAAMAQQHLSAVLRESEPLAFKSTSKSMVNSFSLKRAA